jgi:adenylate kinase
MRLLIMGPPGAGKGTQAVDLASSIGGAHISTGDMFRENLANQTELGKLAQSYMDAGQYVPDEVTNGMVRDRLAQPDAAAFVLDGYPRTADQVAELDDILASMGAKLDGVISLVVADREELVRKRQDVYDAETAALVPIYAERGILHEVDGIGSIDEVAARIAAVVETLQTEAKA